MEEFTVERVTHPTPCHQTVMSLGGGEMAVEETQESGAADGEPSTGQDAIRVVVADDHPIVRYALRQTLTLKCEIGVVGECVVGPDVVKVAAETQADILILDLPTSDSQIWPILRTLRLVGNAARVIILTASENKNQLAQALKLGCAGIVLKQATAEEIASCIRKVHAGEIWVDPRIASVMGQSETPTSNDKVAAGKRSADRFALSEREREVIALVAQGYTNPQIAAKLFISGQTVKNHLHHIYKKTGLETRAELVIHAINNGVHR
jgi:DNA-binding NarL/FixJ family response regulator